MSDDIDLIMIMPSDGADTYAAYSPQIDGFIIGSDSALQLQQDLPEALKFAGVDISRVVIHRHNEYPFTTEEGVDYAIRVAVDAQREDRLKGADRFARAMTDPEQRARLLKSPRTRTGDILFICAIPSDRIKDLARQLHPAGDAAVILVSVADEFVWASNLTNSGDLLDGARPLDLWGLTPNATVAEMMRSQSKSSSRSVLVS